MVPRPVARRARTPRSAKRGGNAQKRQQPSANSACPLQEMQHVCFKVHRSSSSCHGMDREGMSFCLFVFVYFYFVLLQSTHKMLYKFTEGGSVLFGAINELSFLLLPCPLMNVIREQECTNMLYMSPHHNETTYPTVCPVSCPKCQKENRAHCLVQLFSSNTWRKGIK